MGTALVIAGRRGGTRLILAVAALLAVLTAGYGGGTLTEPWNPYLPLLWWVVVLLAVWSVLCGDVAMLPVAVLAASFCAQTHVPYLGLALGMGALATGSVVWRWARERTVSDTDRSRAAAGERRTILRWLAVSAGLGVVLWIPPTIDQLRHDPGNYRQLIDHFASPDEEARGLGEGVDVGLRYLDLTHLARADVTDPGMARHQRRWQPADVRRVARCCSRSGPAPRSSRSVDAQTARWSPCTWWSAPASC